MNLTEDIYKKQEVFKASEKEMWNINGDKFFETEWKIQS